MVWDYVFRYGNVSFIDERHRHRYEVKCVHCLHVFYKEMMHYLVSVVDQYLKETLIVQVNPDMVSQLEKAGLLFVGKDETGSRMEVSISLYLPKYCCVFKPE